MNNEIVLLRRIEDLENYIKRVPEVAPQPIFLTDPLTSTSWNGNDTKTVGTITVDTSTVFGAPAGIKAALIFFRAKWASASVNNFMYVRPVGATRYVGIIYAYSTAHYTESVIVPCDSNGDFEFVVGGANATEVICEIWGYWI